MDEDRPDEVATKAALSIETSPLGSHRHATASLVEMTDLSPEEETEMRDCDATRLESSLKAADEARRAAEEEAAAAFKRATEAEQRARNADATIRSLEEELQRSATSHQGSSGRGSRSIGLVDSPMASSISQYEFIYQIGEGASAEVWVARAPGGETVAVKAIEKSTNAVEPWRVMQVAGPWHHEMQ